MEHPPVLCVGVLVCLNAVGLPTLTTKRHEIVQGRVLTVGSAQECGDGYVRADYIRPYHCQFKASALPHLPGSSLCQVIVKSMTGSGYTAIRGPRGNDIMRLSKDSPVLLKSGYEIFIGMSSTELITLKFIAYDASSVFAQYEFGKVLGQGGFGQVSVARDRRTGEVRAIKRSKYGSKAKEWNNQSVVTEYEVLKYVKHRNIVTMIDGFREPGSFMIVMEFAKYGDLHNYFLRNALDEKLVGKIAKQMLEGTAYLHQRDIAHIDIKPLNVLVFAKSPIHVKVADFGLAHRSGQGDGIVGTPAYQAPEAAIGIRWVGAKLDSFSLGASFFQMLAPDQRTPFQMAPAPQDPLGKPLRMPICWERLPKDMTPIGRQLLQGLLADQPDERTEVAQAINHRWISWANSD